VSDLAVQFEHSTFIYCNIVEMVKELNIKIEILESAEQLGKDDYLLLNTARKVTEEAYAPYSSFCVGAAAHLVNGEVVKGTNQENASFPAGICAERVLMSTASSIFPGIAIDTIAISYKNLNGKSDKPISPCGICRQSMLEFQTRTQHPMRVILSGQSGQIFIINNAADLLPLVFSAEDMK